jgi:hypothetical protein
MTDVEPTFGNTWRYRFARPGDDEIETGDFNGDDTAEAYARELSTSLQCPVVVQRWHGVSWEYVTEADERS